jgi:hypothetical protein
VVSGEPAGAKYLRGYFMIVVLLTILSSIAYAEPIEIEMKVTGKIVVIDPAPVQCEINPEDPEELLCVGDYL